MTGWSRITPGDVIPRRGRAFGARERKGRRVSGVVRSPSPMPAFRRPTRVRGRGGRGDSPLRGCARPRLPACRMPPVPMPQGLRDCAPATSRRSATRSRGSFGGRSSPARLLPGSSPRRLPRVFFPPATRFPSRDANACRAGLRSARGASSALPHIGSHRQQAAGKLSIIGKVGAIGTVGCVFTRTRRRTGRHRSARL